MTLVMRKCKPSPLLTEGDVTTKLNVYEDSDPMAQGYSLYSKATEENARLAQEAAEAVSAPCQTSRHSRVDDTYEVASNPSHVIVV